MYYCYDTSSCYTKGTSYTIDISTDAIRGIIIILITNIIIPRHAHRMRIIILLVWSIFQLLFRSFFPRSVTSKQGSIQYRCAVLVVLWNHAALLGIHGSTG